MARIFEPNRPKIRDRRSFSFTLYFTNKTFFAEECLVIETILMNMININVASLQIPLLVNRDKSSVYSKSIICQVACFNRYL